MSDSNTVPRIGIALIMTYQGRLLIGQRKNQPMPLSWQLPGGWLLYGESPQQAVYRLQQEFDGVECSEAGLVSYTNNLFDTGQHSVSLYFQMECLNATEIDLQANKDCSDWRWADWYDLPQPLFLPLQKLKQSSYEPFIKE